jgi:hypothetical protein
MKKDLWFVWMIKKLKKKESKRKEYWRNESE